MAAKHRPYLTLADLQYLSESCKARASPNLPLITYLDRYILEIQSGFRKPDYKPVPTIAQSLGFDLEKNVDSTDMQFQPGFLLEHFQMTGTFEGLSIKQIAILQHHRYLHDLMSTEEEMEFEKSTLKIGA